MQIAAGEFKAQCLSLMDEVNRKHTTYVITKRGKPVAKLVPVDQEPPVDIVGFLKGTMKLHDDLVAPIGEKWNADE